jgi:PAS domain S-box-containing protein
VHPDDLEGCYLSIANHINGNSPIHSYEYRIRCNNGEYKWILDRGKIMKFDGNGNPSRMIGTLSDISSRKVMEYSIRESEEKYRALVNAMKEGVVLLDHHGAIKTANKAAAQILGLSVDFMIEKKLDALGLVTINENNQPYTKERYPAILALTTGKEQMGNILGVVKNEGTIWISVNAAPIFALKKEIPDFVVVTFFDITDIKETEKKLLKSQKELMDLNKSKNKLFNIIGHDLRNPFIQLGELSKMTLNSIEHNQHEDAKRYAQLIRKCAQSSHDLLLNLLEWSRCETGDLQVNLQETEILPLVNESCNLMASSAYNKNITFNIVSDNAKALADENMLKTILRNLLSNAIKYSFRNGNIDISIASSGASIEIAIKDYGTGIKDDDQKRMFDLHFRQSTPGTANEKGTGLGFVLIREFVDKMNGTLTFDSKFNSGSTFRICLPAVP